VLAAVQSKNAKTIAKSCAVVIPARVTVYGLEGAEKVVLDKATSAAQVLNVPWLPRNTSITTELQVPFVLDTDGLALQVPLNVHQKILFLALLPFC
jgi:hypothetical protein